MCLKYLTRILQGFLKIVTILVIASDTEAILGMGVLFQARISISTFAGQWFTLWNSTFGGPSIGDSTG